MSDEEKVRVEITIAPKGAKVFTSEGPKRNGETVELPAPEAALAVERGLAKVPGKETA